MIETIESQKRSGPVAKMLSRANEMFASAELKLSGTELVQLKKFLGVDDGRRKTHATN